MNLNNGEAKLFEMLKGGRTVTLDEIQTRMCTKIKSQPAMRKALIVRMKYLSAKVAQEGWIITSELKGRGRGVKVSYKMIRMF